MEKSMKNEPKRPLKDEFLGIRLKGGDKTPSDWATLAQEAELEERWDDAHYYWSAGAKAYTRSPAKSKEMKLNAFKTFEKWLETI